MNSNKLWTKLYTRNEEADEIALHISGATTRHRNPFENIEVPRNEEDLTQQFLDKWVIPFYMNGLSIGGQDTIIAFTDAVKEISKDIVAELLGDFDWRPRIVGAYFAAINRYNELDDIIGKHLLKSEVSYAGYGYCLALATFGTDKTKEYLTTYLNYYLTRKDLWFDQPTAFYALNCINKNEADKLLDLWNSFIIERKHLRPEEGRQSFKNAMLIIEDIQRRKG